MNYLYLYDPHTKEYAGKTIKQLNTVATENKGKPVYFTVPNSTDIEPPQLNTPGVTFCFNETTNDWVPVDDNRNRMVINTETKEVSLYPLLGDIKPPYTTDIPSNFAINFVTYDNGQWKLTDRAMVLDNIWDLRKRIRDEKCKAPVEYHGHLFKCNRVSINDMLTALEEIRLTNDLSNTISLTLAFKLLIYSLT